MIVTQQLLERKDGSGLVPATEIMAVTPAVQNLIREAKTAQMQSALLTGVSEGSLPMDNSIIDLYRRGLISSTTALENARDRDYVKRSIDMRSAHKR
jgi:twitching motility protein PilT